MPFSALNVPLPAVQSYLVRTAPADQPLRHSDNGKRTNLMVPPSAHGLVQNAPLRAAGLPAASLDATLHEARVAGRVARFNKQRFGPRCCVVGGLLDRQVIAVA